MRVLDSMWFSTPQGLTVGFVLVAPEIGGRKIYCGFAAGLDQAHDAVTIAKHGARVPIKGMIEFLEAGLDDKGGEAR